MSLKRLQPPVKARQPLSMTAGMVTGICTWAFPTVSAQQSFHAISCEIRAVYRIMITSDQTKPRGVSITSELAVELPWVCSCFIVEHCTAELHPRAHRGRSELSVPLRASLLQLPSCFGGGSCLEKVPSVLEPIKELFSVGESRSVKILRPACGSLVSGRSHRAFGKQPTPVFCRLWRKVYLCLLTVYQAMCTNRVCG